MRCFLRFMFLTTFYAILVVNITSERVLAQQDEGPAPELIITMIDSLENVPEGTVALRDEEGRLQPSPGDQVRFFLEAQNVGTDAAYDVEVVYPIPEGTEYTMESATSDVALITYSIDDGKTFVLPPVMYEEKNEAGKLEVKPAPASMFTHIKWLFAEPIQPMAKKTGQVVIKVSDQ